MKKKTYSKDFDKGRADYPRGDKLDYEQKLILSNLRTKKKADETLTPLAEKILKGLIYLEKLEDENIPFSSVIEFSKKGY